MDMKSIKVVWLIALGSEGKRRLLTSDNMDESCPAAGVFPAGVPWATGPSTTAGPSTAGFWWCAGPATPAGSSSSCAGPSPADSWPCAGSATSSGSSTISGSSSVTMTGPLADPSPADPSYAGPSSAGPSLAGSSSGGLSPAGPSPAKPSIASVWPVTPAGSPTSAGPHFSWTRHNCRFFNVFWLVRRRNHCDGSSLWWLGNGRGQLYLPSGDVGWSRLLSTFTSSRLMMTRQRLAICRRPQWWWRQWPTITRWLAMMVMGMRGRPWRPDIRRPRRDTARPRTTRRISLSPGAGPTRWRGTGPLPLSMSTVVSRRMMGPWRVLASVRPMWSPIALPTTWPVAFRPLRPGTSVGPFHHWHAGRHGLLGFTGPGRPAGRLLHLRSLRPRTCGCLGSLRFGRPVALTLGRRKLKGIFRSVYLDWVVHHLSLLGLLSLSATAHWLSPELARLPATNPCRPHRVSLQCTKWGPRLDDTADSGSGCHCIYDSACSPGTWVATQWKTTGPPSCQHRHGWIRRRNKSAFLTKSDFTKHPHLRATDERYGSHKLSSFRCSNLPGKATGTVRVQTDIRTRARQKSKWTTGGYSALRRCGCTRSGKGT